MHKKHGHGMQHNSQEYVQWKLALRGACQVSRWDEEGNENVYESFGMGATAKGIDCGVVEWVKCGTPKWFRHVMRLYMSKFEGQNARVRPPGK